MEYYENSQPSSTTNIKEAVLSLPQKKITSLVQKNHEYQRIFMCGPTCIRVVQKSALDYQYQTGMLTKDQHDKQKKELPSQFAIARETFSGPNLPIESQKRAWQYILPKEREYYEDFAMKEDCKPKDMTKYLGNGAMYLENQNPDKLKDLLQKGPAIILWTPPMPDRHSWDVFSHYSIVTEYSPSRKMFFVVDTSTEERQYGPVGEARQTRDESKEDWTTKSGYWVDAQMLLDNWFDEYGKGVAIATDLSKIEPSHAVLH